MNEKERILVLGAILRRIDNFSMTTLDGRLLLQKTVYLLQACGLYLGYHFSWYLYGPYSTELASDGFTLTQLYSSVPKGTFKKKDSEEKFATFMAHIGSSTKDAHWLELLASIHFLTELYPQKERTEIIAIVQKKQHYFSLAECKKAWDYLKEWRLIDPKD